MRLDTEIEIGILKYIPQFKHGHSSNGVLTPTYISWRGMLQRSRGSSDALHKRCYAGIACCERWLVFANFLADMGERPAGRTLERIDNKGHYEPLNCRWATHSEQMRNRRRMHRQPKSHCKHGHAFSPENTFFHHGYQACRQCRIDRAKAWRINRIVDALPLELPPGAPG